MPQDIPLSFDANNGYSAGTAIEQGKRFEQLGIAHFEEPLPQYDDLGLKLFWVSSIAHIKPNWPFLLGDAPTPRERRLVVVIDSAESLMSANRTVTCLCSPSRAVPEVRIFSVG